MASLHNTWPLADPVAVHGRSHSFRNMQCPVRSSAKLEDLRQHDTFLNSPGLSKDKKTQATSLVNPHGAVLNTMQLDRDWTLAHSRLAESASTMAAGIVDCVVSSTSSPDIFEGAPLCRVLQRANHMIEEGVFVPSIHLCNLLQRCIDENDLLMGNKVYDIILRSRQELDAGLGCNVILMFASLGALAEAREAFKKVPEPDILMWSCIISAHVSQGFCDQAIDLYNHLWLSDIKPNRQIFIAVVHACSSTSSSAASSMNGLDQGRKVHAHMVQIGLSVDNVVGNTLIDMYAKCGSLEEAYWVFSNLSERDVVSWNTLISGNVHNRRDQEALYVFNQMRRDRVGPNRVTLLAVLKACSGIASFEVGEKVVALTVELGLDQNISLGSSLIDMCTKCGMLVCGRTLFNRMCLRDDVTWNVLIEGYVEHGLFTEALGAFHQMQAENVNPTSFTFVSVFRACSSSDALEEGRQIYIQASALGMEFNLFVSNSLIDMYSRCGVLEEAKYVFDNMQGRDAVTWSALISGYVQHGHGQVAIELFERMKDDGGIEPDPVLYVTVLKACASSESLEYQRKMHACIVESGFESNAYVSCTVIDMYAKAGFLDDACIGFCRLPIQNVVTWSAIIAGHVQQGRPRESLLAFKAMQQEGLEPNQVTFVCAIQACTSTAALETGMVVHAQIIEAGGLAPSEVFVGTALIDMYSRCGRLQDAVVIFNILPRNNVVTWNAVLAGFVSHNDHKSAFNVYMSMMQASIEPNDVTFLSLLSACGRAGLVEEGCIYFKSIMEKHMTFLNSQHLNSLVDLLGRAGLLLEAEEVLEISPLVLDPAGWTSLLSSSKRHGCVEVGKRCFDYMVASSKANAGTYKLMSSIYRCAEMQERAEKVDSWKRDANAWKKPAKAYIEVDKKVHEFLKGDRSHPQWPQICTRLKALKAQLSTDECISSQMVVKEDDIHGAEEDVSCEHSEKLAIVFGLISTANHATLRVMKNLRMCDDCHSMALMVSKIEKREIFVSDAYCVHHFHGMTCSCEGLQ